MLIFVCASACSPPASRVLDPSRFAYDGGAALDIRGTGETPFRGGTALDISYKSPMDGRVPAYLYLPDVAEPRAPALILLHGMGGTRSQLGRLAVAYARAGVVVLTISAPEVRFDLPYRTERLFAIPLFNEYDAIGMEQMGKDIRRGVDLLFSRPDVDTSRVGAVGFSLGGAYASLAAAIEPRLKVFALLSPTSGLVTWLESVRPEHPVRSFFEAMSPDEQARWRSSMWPLEPVRWLSLAPSRPFLLQAASQDVAVSKVDTELLYSALPEPKQLVWYDSGHDLPAEALHDQAEYLARHLGFDATRFEPQANVRGVY